MDSVLEVAWVAGAVFLSFVVLSVAAFVLLVTASALGFRWDKWAEQAEETSLAMRRFLHVFATEWRLYDLVGWLNEKLERRPPNQYKLVPLLPRACPHDNEPDDENLCPDCGMLFIRVVYEDWVKLGKPKYLFRFIHRSFEEWLDKDTRIKVHGGEVIEIIPKDDEVETVTRLLKELAKDDDAV